MSTLCALLLVPVELTLQYLVQQKRSFLTTTITSISQRQPPHQCRNNLYILCPASTYYITLYFGTQEVFQFDLEMNNSTFCMYFLYVLYCQRSKKSGHRLLASSLATPTTSSSRNINLPSCAAPEISCPPFKWASMQNP